MQLLAPVGGEMLISIGTADNTVYAYDYDPDSSWKNKHYAELSGTATWDKADTAKPLNDIQVGTE